MPLENSTAVDATEAVLATVCKIGPDVLITDTNCFTQMLREAATTFPQTFGRLGQKRAVLRAIGSLERQGGIQRFGETSFRATGLAIGEWGHRTYNHLKPEHQAAVLWIAEKLRQIFSVRQS